MNAQQQQIQTAVQQGDYAKAENLIQQVLQQHPNSAKAHYIHAEVLAHQSQFKQAQQEVAAAKQLDPKITFTSPEKFGKFEAYLDVAAQHQSHKSATHSQTATVAPAQQAPEHTIGVLPILTGVLVLLLIVYLISRIFRRPAVIASAPSYPSNAGQGYSNGPNYYPAGSNGGTTIINNTGASGSGAGTAVAAGLGGLAAGMMLERALDERHEGGLHEAAPATYQQPAEYVDDSEANYAEQQLQQQPIDMGNDDSSWDDNSGGDSFDSGSNDNW